MKLLHLTTTASQVLEAFFYSPEHIHPFYFNFFTYTYYKVIAIIVIIGWRGTPQATSSRKTADDLSNEILR